MMIWIKFRTLHSAGPGPWDWREFNIPIFWTTPERVSYFEDNYRDELHDELCTQSEHWRGIEWDFENPPADFLLKYIRACEYRIQSASAAIERARELLTKS